MALTRLCSPTVSPCCHSLAPVVTLSAVWMTVGTQTVGGRDGRTHGQPGAAGTHREGGSLLRMAEILASYPAFYSR